MGFPPLHKRGEGREDVLGLIGVKFLTRPPATNRTGVGFVEMKGVHPGKLRWNQPKIGALEAKIGGLEVKIGGLEAKIGGLEDDVPFQLGDLLVSMLIFRGKIRCLVLEFVSL